MIDIHQIVAILVVVSFFALGVFGVLASHHIDEKKKEEATGHIYTWGPCVSECILTKRGLQWAKWRNIAAACFGGIVVLYGITMSILQK